MLPDHFSEGAILSLKRVQRSEVLADLLPQPFRIAARNLLRKRLFRYLRGIDPETPSLGVKIGIEGHANRLLGRLDIVGRRSHVHYPCKYHV